MPVDSIVPLNQVQRIDTIQLLQETTSSENDGFIDIYECPTGKRALINVTIYAQVALVDNANIYAKGLVVMSFQRSGGFTTPDNLLAVDPARSPTIQIQLEAGEKLQQKVFDAVTPSNDADIKYNGTIKEVPV